MKTVIKYANRKLYDKEVSKYVTLTELLALPLGSFKVVTYNSNQDITSDTLLSALTGENVEATTKVRVMEHCLANFRETASPQVFQ